MPHYENTAVVPRAPAEVFADLDDQTRLSDHMSKSSWMTAGSRMEIRTDEKGGKAVGSRIILEGRVFGLPLLVEEVVTFREPPRRKQWRTIGTPRLLVIGPYTMGFDLAELSAGQSRLTVSIEYEAPADHPVLGAVLGGFYARWCVNQMIQDAVARAVRGVRVTTR